MRVRLLCSVLISTSLAGAIAAQELVTTGAYQLREISQQEQNFLYEGKVITDKTYGHATYGCMACCGYNTEFGTPYLISDPTFVGIGDDSPVNVFAVNACSGIADEIDSYFPNWSTLNTSILTAAPESVHGVGTGSTTIQADATGLPTGEGQHSRTGCPKGRATGHGTGNVPQFAAQVVSDVQGPPQACPSNGIWMRQMTMQIVNQKQPYSAVSIVESVSNLSTNTCGNGAPSITSQCQPPISASGPSGNGQFLDMMSVSQASCNSGISQSSGCGYSSISTWSLCGALTNSFWHSPRVIHSNNIKVNGNTTNFKQGIIIY